MPIRLALERRTGATQRERDDDAELTAYNAMLAQLAQRDTPKRSG
jgi:hypothetical protein